MKLVYLDQNHWIELARSAQRLASYMLKLSALSPYFPGRVSPTPLQLLGSGLTHAADHNFGFQLDWPPEASVIPRHFREAVEAQFLSLAHEALLSGVVADPAHRPPS